MVIEEIIKAFPILGFAYDGNPIYGPYGYQTKTGGIISPDEVWI